MVSLHHANRKIAAFLFAACAAHLMGFTPANALRDGLLRVEFPNGIEATIYPADYLTGRTTFDGTRGRIELDDNVYIPVVTDVSDPLVTNKGDGSFHPFLTDQVVDLLYEIKYQSPQLSVEIFVLPFPRSDVLVSSTSGRRIFLGPQVREISRESAAFILAHEMGHVFQHRYLPADDHQSWLEYRGLRGIEDADIYNSMARHADRPAEIFAEDFRVLYGGPTAYFDGRVENTNLVQPAMVPGLYAFFARLTLNDRQSFILGVNNYPNPFNPNTELHVQLSPYFFHKGDPLSIRIYDVRGALVRELYSDRPTDVDVRVDWDGRDQRGQQVASSTYFGVVQAGNAKVSRKLLMIK
jgi:hypothetical protein